MSFHLKRCQKDAIAVLLCVLGIVLIFASGLLLKGQTWGYMEYLNLHFKNGVFVRTAEGGTHGVQNTGPGFNLPRGDYRLKYWIKTDGECAINIWSYNNARITPNRIIIGPDEDTHEIDLHIEDAAREIQIETEFRSGTYMDVYEIRLYTPEYADLSFTASFVLIAVCMLYILRGHGILDAKRISHVLLLAVAIIVVSAPALKSSYTLGHDSQFHLMRLANLASGLADGQFPVRLGGFSYNGYGAVTSAFYPDLLLYPFALMLLAGASVPYVFNLISIILTVFAAVFMYVCAKRIFKNSTVALCAAVLYVCAPYRLDDLFVRSALGETLSMTLMPLFVLGLWEVYLGDERRWPLLALVAFSIFMSHIISTLMCAMLAILMGVLCLPRFIKRPARLLACLKAALVTVLLSLFFLVPLLDLTGQGINADSIDIYKLHQTALAPGQLLLQGIGELSSTPEDTQIARHATDLGLPVVLGVALMIHAFLLAKDRRESRMQAGMLLLVMGAIFAIMCTTLFPWSYVSAVTDLFDKMQFAWRFLAPATMLLTLAAAWGYYSLLTSPEHGTQLVAMLTAFALIIILPITGERTRADLFIRFGEGADASSGYREYTLPNTTTLTPGDYAFAADGVEVTQYEKEGARIDAHVQSEAGGVVSFPLFAYDGYHASIDDAPIALYPGENNRITLDIPADTDGTLRIWYENKPLWRVADALSLFAAAALAAMMIRRRNNTRCKR